MNIKTAGNPKMSIPHSPTKTYRVIRGFSEKNFPWK
jgi:hypothetical protein